MKYGVEILEEYGNILNGYILGDYDISFKEFETFISNIDDVIRLSLFDDVVQYAIYLKEITLIHMNNCRKFKLEKINRINVT